MIKKGTHGVTYVDNEKMFTHLPDTVNGKNYYDFQNYVFHFLGCVLELHGCICITSKNLTIYEFFFFPRECFLKCAVQHLLYIAEGNVTKLKIRHIKEIVIISNLGYAYPWRYMVNRLILKTRKKCIKNGKRRKK